MAVQTPIAGSRFDIVNGNIRQVNARFASVTAADTWATGLGVVTHCVTTYGNADAQVTIAGSTVTFVTSGTNAQVVAYGF